MAKTVEQWTREFHDLYEQLAPHFGYETRTETRQFDPASANGQLMMRVVGAIIVPLEAAYDAECAAHWRAQQERDESREALSRVEDELTDLRLVRDQFETERDRALVITAVCNGTLPKLAQAISLLKDIRPLLCDVLKVPGADIDGIHALIARIDFLVWKELLKEEPAQ